MLWTIKQAGQSWRWKRLEYSEGSCYVFLYVVDLQTTTVTVKGKQFLTLEYLIMKGKQFAS